MEWFFKLVKNKNYSYLCEEIICIMTISIVKYSDSPFYTNMLLDVLDICYRLVNWNEFS